MKSKMHTKPNTVIVSVEHDDILALTLPRNRPHLGRVAVVTAASDQRTQDVARQHDAEVVVTNSFWRPDGAFDKWPAVEAGFEALGRQGWQCLIDADIVLPADWQWPEQQTFLYSAHRRQGTPADLDAYWPHLPRIGDTDFGGYLHIFHATTPVWTKHLPWYAVPMENPFLGDWLFERRWPPDCRVRLPFDVLHIGPPGRNWFGRQTARLDGEAIEAADARRAAMAAHVRARRRLPRWLADLGKTPAEAADVIARGG